MKIGNLVFLLLILNLWPRVCRGHVLNGGNRICWELFFTWFWNACPAWAANRVSCRKAKLVLNRSGSRLVTWRGQVFPVHNWGWATVRLLFVCTESVENLEFCRISFKYSSKIRQRYIDRKSSFFPAASQTLISCMLGQRRGGRKSYLPRTFPHDFEMHVMHGPQTAFLVE